MKYKQKIIPSVVIPDEWCNLSKAQLRKVVLEYIRANLAGMTIKNLCNGINVHISVSSGRKTTYGEAIYLKKAACVLILPNIIRYATYNNFGEKKAQDSNNILGYLNYKCKCRIDGKIENIRLAIRLQNDGKFYYNIEVNKIELLPKKPRR